MNTFTAQEIYAHLYDAYVFDWPGEMDFYRQLIAHPSLRDQGVLEIACGTGRITLQLAKEGINITGLDLSSELLEVAKNKSTGLSNIQWIKGDMRDFELGKKFGYVIMPGHSFQAMNTPDEQVQCLERIKHHLIPDGLLVLHLDHQDFTWLAGLLDTSQPAGKQECVITYPASGQRFRRQYVWSFEPSTQTAAVRIEWQQLDENENCIQRWEMEPMRLHCVFPFEMEHALRRVGFSIEAVYGDFFKNELTDRSSQMIWVARNARN